MSSLRDLAFLSPLPCPAHLLPPQPRPAPSPWRPTRTAPTSSSPGTAFLWSAGGVSSWDTAFTSATVQRPRSSVNVTRAVVVFFALIIHDMRDIIRTKNGQDSVLKQRLTCVFLFFFFNSQYNRPRSQSLQSERLLCRHLQVHRQDLHFSGRGHWCHCLSFTGTILYVNIVLIDWKYLKNCNTVSYCFPFAVLAADWIVLMTLTSLGITALLLVIILCICCKKRNWWGGSTSVVPLFFSLTRSKVKPVFVPRVKKAFYPDIPEPKLTGDWSRTQVQSNFKPNLYSYNWTWNVIRLYCSECIKLLAKSPKFHWKLNH